MNNTIKIHCAGINCHSEIELTLPDGWQGTAYSEEDIWCPQIDCQLQKQFFDAVCPGCVAGPVSSTCPLYRLFAYSETRAIEQTHYEVLQSGRCPSRVNGTSVVSIGPSGINMCRIDISSRPSADAGRAVATAIMNYCIEYPVP